MGERLTFVRPTYESKPLTTLATPAPPETGSAQRWPRQFWVLLACLTVNRMAASLIWPYITLFIQQSTGASLSQVTALLPIQSIATVIGISTAGVLFDRFGRKPLMVGALVAFAALMLIMSGVQTLWLWAALIGFYGILQPLFLVGSNAMVADLIPEADRPRAYALVRMMANLSIALGPALGGPFIARSHLFAYYGVAALNLAVAVPVAALLAETLPQQARLASQRDGTGGGYGEVLRDRPFVAFIAVLVLVELGIAMVFNLLAVYTKTYFGIAEDSFGLLLTINAGMVVAFQVAITRALRRFQPFPILAAASVIYGVALIAFGFSGAFAGFAFSMALLTVGELMLSHRPSRRSQRPWPQRICARATWACSR